MTCDLEIFATYVIANYRTDPAGEPGGTAGGIFHDTRVKRAESVQRLCNARSLTYTKTARKSADRYSERNGESGEKGNERKKRRGLDSYTRVPLARERRRPSSPSPLFLRRRRPHGQASLRGNLRSRPELFPLPRVRQDGRDGSALTMDSTHPTAIARAASPSAARPPFFLLAAHDILFLSLPFHCR